MLVTNLLILLALTFLTIFSAIFLLKIIYQFLHDETLKHLLEDKSVNLLRKALHIIKPGIHLVCRLYWRKDGWQRMDSIEKILNSKTKIEPFMLRKVLSSLIENGYIDVCNNNGKVNDIFFKYFFLMFFNIYL